MKNDKLNEVQKAFVDKDGLQCGFCTPGQIISAYALLKKNPNPDEEEIREAMSGNVCRCGAYPKIIESVNAASKLLNG
jgi:aerobic-type carbon monoxide dehydrogenase small subunit (CoxS/CutS family)